jgi:hypothetical protein
MYCASLYSKEIKTTRTNISKILETADSTCFEVQFTTQINEKSVLEKLKLNAGSVTASEVLKGHEHTLVCKSIKNDSKMGRSLVIELSTNAFKQVDHRTV